MPFKLQFILQKLKNIFRNNSKIKDRVSPLQGPDGALIVDGAKFVANEHIYGYNINPDILQGEIKPGRYLIVKGTVLELLQCERPIGYAPYRWTAFDSNDRVGHIWVHANELTYESGTFGIRE